jgi:sugar phosphate isomerase/epimerase
VPGGGLVDIVGAAGTNGFAAVTITSGHYDDALAGGMSAGEVRDLLREAGVRVAVIDPLIGALPGVPAPDAVDAAMRRYFTYTAEDCWRAAEGVGAETINLAHFLGRPVELAALQDSVARLAEANHARGFATTFEFIPGTGVPDLATALAVTQGSRARIMLDTWHLARSGGAAEQIEALPAGAIGGVQLNDWSPPAPGEAYVPMSGRRLPGEGDLPLARILAAVEANSPGLDVCMEVFSAELAALGWQAAAARMARTGQAALDAAAREGGAA